MSYSVRNHYSFSEWFKTAYSVFTTKIWIPKARIVRKPVYIRGIKSLVGAKELTTGRFCRFDLSGEKKSLFIGDNCEFGDMTHIVAYKKVIIGNNVLIASKCFISDTDHGNYKGKNQSLPVESPKSRELIFKPTIIGDNVWIGENVVILAGTIIGDGCIVGANSVVKGNFENNTILAGVPAKKIKCFNMSDNVWEREELRDDFSLYGDI